jgi:hypothetical protein
MTGTLLSAVREFVFLAGRRDDRDALYLAIGCPVVAFPRRVIAPAESGVRPTESSAGLKRTAAGRESFSIAPILQGFVLLVGVSELSTPDDTLQGKYLRSGTTVPLCFCRQSAMIPRVC